MKTSTPAVKRILRLAKIEAARNDEFIGVNHIMIAMMLDGDNFGSFILTDAGFTVEALRKSEGPVAKNK